MNRLIEACYIIWLIFFIPALLNSDFILIALGLVGIQITVLMQMIKKVIEKQNADNTRNLDWLKYEIKYMLHDATGDFKEAYEKVLKLLGE